MQLYNLINLCGWNPFFAQSYCSYINFGTMLLLNELSYWPQFGLILKSCVCSLKWAQVEVISSFRLADIGLQSCISEIYFLLKFTFTFKQCCFLTNWANDLNLSPFERGAPYTDCILGLCWIARMCPLHNVTLTILFQTSQCTAF